MTEMTKQQQLEEDAPVAEERPAGADASYCPPEHSFSRQRAHQASS